jgi:hypothetical protein
MTSETIYRVILFNITPLHLEATEKYNTIQINDLIFPTVSSPTEALNELPINKSRIKPEAVAVT